MVFSSLLHLKTLMMVLTAAGATVTGGLVANSYIGSGSKTGSFLLTLDPSTLTVEQGASSISMVTVTSINGYSGAVILTTYTSGAVIGVSFSPSSVVVPANGNAKSTLTITAPLTVGDYSLVVIGTNNNKRAYSATALTLHVESNRDFTVTVAPATITNILGTGNTTTISLASLNGFAGNVSLTVTTPFGYISVTGAQNPVTLTSGSTATTTLTIATSTITAIGTYSITVTGTSGARSHSAIVALNVVDPVIPVVVESLILTGSQFVNGTMLTLNLQNRGNDTVTLQSYTVEDIAGNSWTMTNWQGLTLAPATQGTASILIGSSCPTCIYTGIPGLFFQFTAGHTYSVTVTTTRNSQFTFTLTN